MYDIIIIGAGVSGCAVARELARFDLNICVVDKESDVCEGTSKANSAIIHAGFDAKEGTLMAKLNVLGSEMMEELSEKLDFPYWRNGSLVCCRSAEEVPALQALIDRGVKNGVKGMRIVYRDELISMEPNLADAVYAAAYAPTGAIVCPFLMTIAFAENAADNGVEFRLSTKVENILPHEGGYTVVTDRGNLESGCVINAAGVYADVFHNMVSRDKIHITPRRGEYCLLDRRAGGHVSHTIFQLPTKMGKGVLVTPTVHKNLLIGPNSVDIGDKDDLATTGMGLAAVMEKSNLSVKGIDTRQIITSFSGLRAHEDGHEFIIKELEDAPHFIDVAGIESPGLSSAPAIGVMVRDIVETMLHPAEKENFTETRQGIHRFAECSPEEQRKLLKENPAYGQIVCRCEKVTEGDIMAAIHRTLGATTMDGVKRRTRAGMGRCQAGFCTPKTMEIIARELDIPMEDICKNGAGSKLILGTNKDRL